MHDSDRENKVGVVHDGLTNPPNRTGDSIVGGALAFLDEFGGLVNGAQDHIAAGRPQLFTAPGQEHLQGHTRDGRAGPVD
ncbi:hypothetical protein D3C76_1386960 [compost metagenome]